MMIHSKSSLEEIEMSTLIHGRKQKLATYRYLTIIIYTHLCTSGEDKNQESVDKTCLWIMLFSLISEKILMQKEKQQ